MSKYQTLLYQVDSLIPNYVMNKWRRYESIDSYQCQHELNHSAPKAHFRYGQKTFTSSVAGILLWIMAPLDTSVFLVMAGQVLMVIILQLSRPPIILTSALQKLVHHTAVIVETVSPSAVWYTELHIVRN